MAKIPALQKLTHMENTFSTDFIFKIEADPVGDYKQCKKVGQPSV